MKPKLIANLLCQITRPGYPGRVLIRSKPMNPYNFLKQSFLGNTVESYLWFFVILLFGLVLRRLLSKLFSRLLFGIFKRYGKSVGVQKFLALMSKPIEVLFSLLIVYLAFDRLVFPHEWNLVPEHQFGVRLVVFKFFRLALIISLFWIVLRTLDFIGLVMVARARRTESLMDDQIIIFSKEAVKIVVAGIGFFILLGYVFNLDIVSLLTGLGIGGLAIALAAKESLENLIGSFTIFLDKPFVIGDQVRVGNIEGNVEMVGFRSTRIRSLDKMVITVPNKKMIEAEIVNETDRSVRRSSVTIPLDYQTSEEQLKNILSEIRILLDENPLIENGTGVARFRNFGSTGLEILIIFFVLSIDLVDFLKVQEEINFQIMNVVKKNNSFFAISALYKSSAPEVLSTVSAGKVPE